MNNNQRTQYMEKWLKELELTLDQAIPSDDGSIRFRKELLEKWDYFFKQMNKKPEVQEEGVRSTLIEGGVHCSECGLHHRAGECKGIYPLLNS